MATPQSTIADIALEHPASVRVFEKLGIDYCCGGSKPLAEACREHSLDVKSVMAELEKAGKEIRHKNPDWASQPLEFICKHIVETHHAYILTEMPRLSSLARKVVLRHSEAHPELGRIQELIESLAVELLLHLHKEEMSFFPLSPTWSAISPTADYARWSVLAPCAIQSASSWTSTTPSAKRWPKFAL